MKIEIFNNTFLYLEDDYFNPLYFNINSNFHSYYITNEVIHHIINNSKYIYSYFYTVLMNIIIQVFPLFVFHVPREYPYLYNLVKKTLQNKNLYSYSKNEIFRKFYYLPEIPRIMKEDFPELYHDYVYNIS